MYDIEMKTRDVGLEKISIQLAPWSCTARTIS